MSRKLGREKKSAFDHFSRDLGVNPFLPLRWVVRDGPAVQGRASPQGGGTVAVCWGLALVHVPGGTEAECS